MVESYVGLCRIVGLYEILPILLILPKHQFFVFFFFLCCYGMTFYVYFFYKIMLT